MKIRPIDHVEHEIQTVHACVDIVAHTRPVDVALDDAQLDVSHAPRCTRLGSIGRRTWEVFVPGLSMARGILITNITMLGMLVMECIVPFLDARGIVTGRQARRGRTIGMCQEHTRMFIDLVGTRRMDMRLDVPRDVMRGPRSREVDEVHLLGTALQVRLHVYNDIIAPRPDRSLHVQGTIGALSRKGQRNGSDGEGFDILGDALENDFVMRPCERMMRLQEEMVMRMRMMMMRGGDRGGVDCWRVRCGVLSHDPPRSNGDKLVQGSTGTLNMPLFANERRIR